MRSELRSGGNMTILMRSLLLGCFIISGPPLGALAQTSRLRIIHTNDMHARFDQTSQLSGKCTEGDAAGGRCYGGFPRLLTAINEQRSLANKTGVPLLLLNAGDTYQGTLWYSVYKWPIVAAFIDLLGLDAMSLGNHEFDDGPSGLAPYLRNVSVPVLGCNLGLAGEPSMANTTVTPSIVIERGGLRIGIIGYLTPETMSLSQPGRVMIYDEVGNMTSEARRLKEAGVSIIIALGHSGYERDMEIARDVPHVDIVVGGHSHSFLYTGQPPDNDIPVGPYPTMVKQASGRLVPVVQAYAFTKYLGVLDVELDSQGEVVSASGQPVLLKSSIEQDASVLEELQKWQGGIDNITQQQIATTRVLLNGTCRFTECNLGNIITDAMVDYAVRNSAVRNWTGAAIAIYSGGGVRTSISPINGVITREDVIIAMPFYNPLVMVRVQGRYLLEALEWSVARYDTNLVVGRGEFLQVSGIHVKYNLSLPVGSRVVSAAVRCAQCQVPAYSPIDPEASYSLVASSFLANGGDNYTMIAEHKTVLEQFDGLDTDVVSDFVQRRQLLYDGTEDRIMFVQPSAVAAASSHSSSYTLLGLLPTTLLSWFFRRTFS